MPRVRAWQGIPDITVDNADQLTVLETPPWDAGMDLTNHAVDVSLTDVVAGPSRVGMKTHGMLVSVREDSASSCDARSAVVCFVMAHVLTMVPNEGNEDSPSTCGRSRRCHGGRAGQQRCLPGCIGDVGG